MQKRGLQRRLRMSLRVDDLDDGLGSAEPRVAA